MPAVRDEEADVVKAGAFRLSLGTQIGAAIVALVTALDPIFGDSFSPGQKTAIIVAAIATFALVTATDVVARSLTATRQRQEVVLPPKGLPAKWPAQSGTAAERGWTAVAMRTGGAPSKTEFLVAKHGQQAQWVDGAELDFS